MLFGFGPRDRIELDPRPLLRADFAARIDGLVKGTQGGLIKPNEARLLEGWSPAEGGDELYMQRQMTPLAQLDQIAAAETAAASQPPAPPAPLVPDPAEAKALVAGMLHRRALGVDDGPTGSAAVVADMLRRRLAA